ncbi:MAG: hypothetical protein Q8P51_01345 [Ignavibacteria bacterium]|nr:hypothetical protein [Ignavibacteria bacterium]
MEISKDFEEFFELLNRHKARYLIVGGYAFAIHAKPRFTNDIDIFLDAEQSNAQNVLEALKGFGFGEVGITLRDLVSPEQVIQLGFPPLRIDLLTSISSVAFADAWARRVSAKYGEQTVYFISKQDLIANKKGAGRKKDLEDLEELL